MQYCLLLYLKIKSKELYNEKFYLKNSYRFTKILQLALFILLTNNKVYSKKYFIH